MNERPRGDVGNDASGASHMQLDNNAMDCRTHKFHVNISFQV